MPRIFENIDLSLLPTLRETLKVSYRADFCDIRAGRMPTPQDFNLFRCDRTPVVKSGDEILTVLDVFNDGQFSVNNLFQCLYLD